ncbi:MAG: nucleotide sugar dehydrogenase [Bacteroidetes bacterium]|nr:nucleotide sugar dehydrogenase [Bacteroidota bacterium]
MGLFQQIESGEKSICVIGLGYVGLPIALEFAKKFNVVGFDINASRVALMQQGIDPSKEMDASEFANRKIVFTSDPETIKSCSVYIVAVPTPINEANEPDLKPLIGSSTAVGRAISKGDYVIYESTTYPGCTEEDCVPVIEEISGLKMYTDFKVGYSPERINPGDKERPLTKILKIVSGCDEESLNEIAKLYESIIEPGVYRAASIKVAEAAKIIENTQRDVNISLMNELSMIFDKVGINTYDVIEAAGTKWNFHKYTPGLVGGHCIGVDPYYLLHKAESMGLHPRVIAAGRFTNDSMAAHIAQAAIKKLNKRGKVVKDCHILIMGATFKENVADIRNSKIVDIVNELKSYSVNVDVVDPHADSEELKHEYGFELNPVIQGPYDGIILAVSHNEYLTLAPQWYGEHCKPDGFLIDLKGIYRDRKALTGLEYSSL